MDKKNTTIGVLLLIAAMASFWFSARYGPKPSAPLPSEPPPGETATAPTTSTTTGAGVAPASSTPRTVSQAALGEAEKVSLANDFILVTFTNHGGAIDSVALKKHLAVQGETEFYTLNKIQAAPALSLTDFPGADAHTAYTLVLHNDTEVVYRATSETLEVTRRYSLAKAPDRDEYQLRHETVFRNLTDKPLPLPRAVFNVGTAAPLSVNDYGVYLTTGYTDGDDTEFVARGSLEGGGLLSWVGLKDGTPPAFIDRPSAIKWATVKNQFFCMILTPDQPGTGVRIERVKLDPKAAADDRRAYGMTGFAQFDLKSVPANGSTTFGANYFAGPKEYKRLSNATVFKHGEEKIMQFSSGFGKIFFSGFFAPLLLTIMTWVHSFVPSWGWSIVLTTLTLKIVFLPLTLAASRSAKRMAKLQPHMQALREKYKDNPQKMQTETLRIFKENKVNPVGGCVPILLTLPFFIGFYTMLQTTSELRFASFLWVHDLSAPDTVAHIFGFPFNIMPLLLGATTIIQMKLTPTPPTADPAQQTMFKIMPWIMVIFCYGLAAGLALYSTVNGLFTIVQQVIINRMPDPQLPINGGTTPGMKNVTPKKKK